MAGNTDSDVDHKKGCYMPEKKHHVLPSETLKFYAVRGKDGLWFRRKGYSGYGESWVKELDRARIYTKVGHARQQVTFYADGKNTPDVVVFEAKAVKVLNEAQRIAEKREKERQKKNLEVFEAAKHRVHKAQEEYEKAKKALDGLMQ